jgi:hypothetical protein
VAPIRHGGPTAQFSHPADIFLVVRPRLVSIILAAAVTVLSAPGLAAAAKPAKTHHHKKKGLTAAQKLKLAVAAAKRSPGLWATVNRCTSGDTDSSGNIVDTVGIRGEMPSLGVPATLSMNISVSYWNGTAFTPTNATQVVSLGKGTHGLHQTGVDFTFAPPAAGTPYLVRGTITFEWTVGGKVVGKVTSNTGHGYANVGFSTPPGFSAGTCTLT